MNIVCATDGNYLPHCVIMLQTLASHQSDPADLRVYLIIDNVSQEQFENCIPYLYSIIPNLSWLKADPDKVSEFPVNGHATVATYFRLLLPGLLPEECKRAIFIDSDTVVNSSLDRLWQMPLQGKALAAALEHKPSCRDHGYRHGHYFNAGVMLVDLERWRKADVLGLGASFAKANPHRLRHWDQDVLNHVFKDNWLPIGERWNACPHLFGLMPEYSLTPEDLTESEKEAIHDPAIVHFAGPGPVKPWNARCKHPLRHLYLQPRSKTPWAHQPLDDAPPPLLQQWWDQGLFRTKTKVKGWLGGSGY
jgi:lipopolysaccharide biosynthesis glycosyltransferase